MSPDGNRIVLCAQWWHAIRKAGELSRTMNVKLPPLGGEQVVPLNRGRSLRVHRVLNQVHITHHKEFSKTSPVMNLLLPRGDVYRLAVGLLAVHYEYERMMNHACDDA